MLDPGEEFHDLVGLVRTKALKNGGRPALRFPSRTISYLELDRQSDRVASGLRAAGFEVGDRVAALLFNSPEFPLLWFGAAKAGVVVVPLNTALKGDLLRYELLDCGAKGIVVDRRLVETLDVVRAGLPLTAEWRVDSEGAIAGTADARSWSELESAVGPAPSVEIHPWTPAGILYTSGTTGPPKGAVIPHEKYVTTPREIAARSRLDPTSVLFTALPLFHCNAQEMTTLVALENDLLAAYDERFHATTFWESAAAVGATHVSLLISMINVLYKQPEKASDRTHRVRVALTAGATKEIWPAFESRFGLSIIELYGMTECGCTTLMNPPDRVRVGSVGTPLGFVEAQVVDEADRPVPDGQRGELVVRPRQPYTMYLGYLNKADQTVDAWRNLWFHTGDFVTRDADGYYYFVDRKKDVIRRRGENLAPYDVESVLNTHPAVFESVVVGVPSPLGEEDVKAFVRLKPGATVEPRALFDFCAERLPFFMVPRYLEFLDEIPKTANQKAQRYVLRQRPAGAQHDREAMGLTYRPPR
ncbi:MAG TPA: AMP-binding protein [Thermoplasmata archaeon]|nr:AMP-binding protein [Thermoplasmata archaeon]